ncbi:MAG: AI-2E family transporter [Oscillospiraceae bacterium]|nr:AI-2E family transporter [Oscillospiraceae bacterium]
MCREGGEFVVNQKKKWWVLDARTISNLTVVLLGILFFFLVNRFDVVQSKLMAFLDVTTPFIIGFVIAYLLNSPVRFFEQKVYPPMKHRRLLSIVTVYLLAVAILAILLNLILPQVTQSIVMLMSNMRTYLDNFNSLVQSLIETFHIDGEGLTDLAVTYQDIIRRASSLATSALPQIFDLGMAVGSGVVSALTALISSVYMLAGKGKLLSQIRKTLYAILPKDLADWLMNVCREANGVFVGFINGKLIDSAIIGVLCFVLNSLLRIPYAVLIAVVIGVTNVIPFFGPIIGAVPCIMILLIIDPWAALRFGILVLALQQFDGNILGPKILGDSTGLSALWVLVAIVIGGGLFGFVGMLLGVPTFAVLYSLTREWVYHRLEKKGLDGDGNPVKKDRSK